MRKENVSTDGGMKFEFTCREAKENFDRDPEKLIRELNDILAPFANKNAYCLLAKSGVPLSDKEGNKILVEMSCEASARGVCLERVWLERIDAGELDRPDKETMKKLEEAIRKEEERKKRIGRPKRDFRSFFKEQDRADERLNKLHRLIGNKVNTDALKIITRAMWIEWIERPSGTSIRKEFSTITCSDTLISRCLKEAKPYLRGKVNDALIKKIREDYEKA